MVGKYVISRYKSFTYAIAGFRSLLTREPNARIHLAAALLVIAAGFYFQITNIEWAISLLAIAAVFCAEAINTAIEEICDHVTPERHAKIKLIKDLAAAAVWITAMIAAIAGLLIFGPKIIS